MSLQADRAPYACDVVLFVERAGELRCDARLSVKDPSRSESESEKGDKYHVVDPKPNDLTMSRLKQW